jgi:DnaJ-class molecular chaperone
MEAKNYYLVLGVSRTESAEGIRSRYRDLARALHPDVAGAHSTGAFQEVTEAYQILADPAARRRHNDELAGRAGALPVAPVAAPPWRWEPPRRRKPLSVLGAPDEVVRPSLDALIEGLFGNFTQIGIPRSEPPEALTFEVVLTPEEAARGGAVSFGVPALERCRACRGGRLWLSSCGGQGVSVAEHAVRVAIPPMVRHGMVLEVPLRDIGVQNLYLRLLVRIE